jgi:hypothetical protein
MSQRMAESMSQQDFYGNQRMHYMASHVGTLPDGYLKANPLPQIPTKQSVPTSKIRLPPYFGLPIEIPTLHRIVGPAIA